MCILLYMKGNGKIIMTILKTNTDMINDKTFFTLSTSVQF